MKSGTVDDWKWIEILFTWTVFVPKNFVFSLKCIRFTNCNPLKLIRFPTKTRYVKSLRRNIFSQFADLISLSVWQRKSWKFSFNSYLKSIVCAIAACSYEAFLLLLPTKGNCIVVNLASGLGIMKIYSLNFPPAFD